MRIKVTTTVEVYDTAGRHVTTSFTRAVDQDRGDNPLFIGRVAHRLAEQASDELRVALAAVHGEIDPEWKANSA